MAAPPRRPGTASRSPRRPRAPPASSTSTTARGADDAYTLAPGNDANDGLAPERPKASLQNVLATYALDPSTIVVVDAGTYGEWGKPSYGEVTVTEADEGSTIAGALAGTGTRFVHSGTRLRLLDADQMTVYGVTFAGTGGTGIEFDTAAPVSVEKASSDARIERNTFSGPSSGISA